MEGGGGVPPRVCGHGYFASRYLRTWTPMKETKNTDEGGTRKEVFYHISGFSIHVKAEEGSAKYLL